MYGRGKNGSRSMIINFGKSIGMSDMEHMIVWVLFFRHLFALPQPFQNTFNS